MWVVWGEDWGDKEEVGEYVEREIAFEVGEGEVVEEVVEYIEADKGDAG